MNDGPLPTAPPSCSIEPGGLRAEFVLVDAGGAHDGDPPMMDYEAIKDRVAFLAGSWR
jgi:hypothetical protein